MTRMIFSFLALVLAALPAAAQSPAENPVEITADNFTINEASQEAVFTGNVVVVHPSVTVWAPKVVVIYGEGGTSDVESFEATGDVKLETDEQTATGDRAVFDPAARTLRLTGNVTVVNATGTVKGPELLVDLESNTSTFTGGEGGRVTGVFTSQ
jgi:lipopolysaccharide export system protein LptA